MYVTKEIIKGLDHQYMMLVRCHVNQLRALGLVTNTDTYKGQVKVKGGQIKVS